MVKLRSAPLVLALLFVASLALFFSCEPNGEVMNGVGGTSARRLMQQTRATRPVLRNGTSRGASASATASASTSGNGTATAVSVAVNCQTAVAGRAAASVACADEAAPSPEESESDVNEIGFGGKDDRKYCTLCQEEKGCDVCCCYDGECVDRKEAEKGTAFCTMVAAVAGGSPPSSFECAYCRKSGCRIYFHWCR